MLEEHTMEKKNRSQQPSTKGSGTDSKKTQDVQNGKPFPRCTKKREPSGSSNGLKNEPRRPPPQKSKTYDKRPKPRGFYYGVRKENSQIINEDLEEEFGSLFNGGNKKQNLNHLLNFHYEPRGLNTSGRHHVERKSYTTKSLMSTHAHKYNKEQFLQANCQFVVKADGDYGCYLGDPDLLVDWNLVELIRVGSNETVACPICLYPPTAAKITRCGHIYCWMCILHYLALSDKSWRKCPICYEAIHNKDLKSVECFERNAFSVGQNITLQLMKREKGSVIATPVNEFSARSNLPILELSERNFVTVYSKLLLAQRSDIDAIIAKDKIELDGQVKEFEGCPELCFVEQAIENLNQRIQQLSNPQEIKSNVETQENTAEKPSYDYFEDKPIESSEANEDKDENAEGVTRTSQSESCSSEQEITVEDLLIENNSSQATKYFYFYQSIDGQEIYLHSINLRMLEMTYGNLEHCPATIQGKIVEKEMGSMTGELRKRLKYLQHVPITCQFEVVELNLHPPIISDIAAQSFQEQVEMRKKRRQKQARAEKKWEKKIEESMMRGMGIAPQADIRIESHYDFPGCGETDFPRPPSPQARSSRSPSPQVRNHSPTSAAMAALSLDPPEEGPSFAQMLRGEKTFSSEAWPSVGDPVQASTSGAWGISRRQRQPSVRLEDDDYAFSPPARPSFNIAEALEAAARIEKGKDSNPGKKKKKKQKILFTTGMSGNPGN